MRARPVSFFSVKGFRDDQTASGRPCGGLSLAAPALATDASRTPQGHWEWRSAPQYGPRATGPARVRIWVPESRDIASCDCAMMQASAADCMRGAVRSDKG
jgi:hypothetical protein